MIRFKTYTLLTEKFVDIAKGNWGSGESVYMNPTSREMKDIQAEVKSGYSRRLRAWVAKKSALVWAGQTVFHAVVKENHPSEWASLGSKPVQCYLDMSPDFRTIVAIKFSEYEPRVRVKRATVTKFKRLILNPWLADKVTPDTKMLFDGDRKLRDGVLTTMQHLHLETGDDE